jgi:hypothetical protein
LSRRRRPDRAAIALRYATDLSTDLRGLGAELGITGERVRQIVDTELGKGVAQRMRRERRAELKQQQRDAYEASLVCKNCGKPFSPPQRTFCSPVCREWFHYVKKSLNSDGTTSNKQRLSNARSILRHPDKFPPSQIQRAARLVAAADEGRPLPAPNRRMPPFSKIRESLAATA